MAESFWYMKNCDLLSHVPAEDIAWLEGHSRVRRMKRGEPIYLPSQSADGMVLVATGRVKICHTNPDGKQSVIDFVDAGRGFRRACVVRCSATRRVCRNHGKDHANPDS